VAEAPREAILCVDDEVVILLAMRQELRRRLGDRFIVETAHDHRQALETVRGLEERGVRTALVITDWLMPGMRGDELVRSLREDRPYIKAILITGQAGDASSEEARRSGGFDAFIGKPWRPESLYAAIEACLGE